jgi:simple sugar transport system ATP-binding protein
VTHKLAEIRRTAHRVTVLRHGRVVARSDAPADEIDRLVRAMIQRDLAAPRRRCARGGQRGRSVRAAPQVGAPASIAGEVCCRRGSPARRRRRAPPRRIAFTVRRGEIVGIAGVEGNGQSELVAVLAGATAATEGGFRVDDQPFANGSPKALTAAGVGVVPEDRHREGCVPAMSLALNLALSTLQRFRRWGLVDRAALAGEARDRMRAFDIRAAGPEVPFASLSGGNQQKAVLARELSLPGLRLLVAAQPTRGLDVGAVEAIYAQIRAAAERGVAVLLASSELDELLAVADRLLVMYRGRVMGECAATAESRPRIGAWMAGHAA